MLRQIKTEDLVGKTIKEVDISAVNYLKLTFVDETTLEIYAETGYTPLGIPAIVVEDKSGDNHVKRD